MHEHHGAQGPRPNKSYRVALKEFQTTYYRGLLERTRGNVSAVARLADVDRGHLHRLLVRLRIHPRDIDGTD